jgi:hypothetical protein
LLLLGALRLTLLLPVPRLFRGAGKLSCEPGHSTKPFVPSCPKP